MADIDRLVHDLQVHQAELEIQNEELRATESQLQRLQERYFDLYNRAPVGYLSLSPEGVIQEANLTLSLLLNWQTETLVGQTLTSLVAAEDQDKLYLHLKSLRQNLQASSIVLRLKKQDGEPFWARIDSSVVIMPAEPSVFRLMISDITKERHMEQALHLAEKLGFLETLAGGIAHDFNNLLGGIFGYISLARDHDGANPEVVRHLDKAILVFERAKNLTLQLSTFTKHNVPTIKTQEIGPLVEKAVAFALSGTNTLSQIAIEKDLWSACIDENQIAQVLQNLTLNASQAMGHGSLVRIAVSNVVLSRGNPRSLSAGNYLKLTVSDNGTGIPAALSEKIFDPFFTTKNTGHGLGLSICRSIVAKHNGALWVESREGQGTTFHLLLPASVEKARTDSPPQTAVHRGGGTVLVMDDEGFYRDILKAMLQDMGYEVVEAGNGDEALTVGRSERDLNAALLDLTIRGGRGGRDTVAALQSLRPGLPIFAISGFSEDPILARPHDFGFTDCLAKPFLKEDLNALMTKYFG